MILKERLNFHGKIGCAVCLFGSTIVALHAPTQNAPETMDKLIEYIRAPGFIVYFIFVLLSMFFLIWKVVPKYGNTHPIVYITICSLSGGISVVFLQTVGGAIAQTISGNNQFTHWLLYVVVIFVAIALITQINYLNKALNLFITAEVTPLYYVEFTTSTIVSSSIIFQGYATDPIQIITVIFAFLCICGGVLVLQTSRMYESLRGDEENPNRSVASLHSNRRVSNPISEKRANDPETGLEGYESSAHRHSMPIDATRPIGDISQTQIPHTIVTVPTPPSNLRNPSFTGSIPNTIHRIGSRYFPNLKDELKEPKVFDDDTLECSSINYNPVPSVEPIRSEAMILPVFHSSTRNSYASSLGPSGLQNRTSPIVVPLAGSNSGNPAAQTAPQLVATTSSNQISAMSSTLHPETPADAATSQQSFNITKVSKWMPRFEKVFTRPNRSNSEPSPIQSNSQSVGNHGEA